MTLLFEKLSEVAERVVLDPRWKEQKDDLGVQVVGMLLFGLGAMFGRLVLTMEQKEISDCVTRVLTEKLGVAAKWAGGLVEDANLSIFDKDHDSANYELIGVGHQYYGESTKTVVDNIFANIESVRRVQPGAR